MMYPEGTKGALHYNRDVVTQLGHGGSGLFGMFTAIVSRIQEQPGDFIDSLQHGIVSGFTALHDNWAMDPGTELWMATQPYKSVDVDAYGNEWNRFWDDGFDMTDNGFLFLVMILTGMMGAPLVRPVTSLIGRLIKRRREDRLWDRNYEQQDRNLDAILSGKAESTDFSRLMTMLSTEIGNDTEGIRKALLYNSKAWL